MANYRVDTITLDGGAVIPAYLLICPQCNKLDMKTSVDTSSKPWVAMCSKEHTWDVVLPQPQLVKKTT